MAEVIRNKEFACQTLQAAFDLTLESAKILRMIRDVRQGSDASGKNSFYSGNRGAGNDTRTRPLSNPIHDNRSNAKTNRVSANVVHGDPSAWVSD